MKRFVERTCNPFLNLPRLGFLAKMCTRHLFSTALITRRLLTSWSRDKMFSWSYLTTFGVAQISYHWQIASLVLWYRKVYLLVSSLPDIWFSFCKHFARLSRYYNLVSLPFLISFSCKAEFGQYLNIVGTFVRVWITGHMSYQKSHDFGTTHSFSDGCKILTQAYVTYLQ